MRVVLDTNVIVSALYSKRGASYQLLKAAISGELSCALSPLMALEYEGVVSEKIEEGFLNVTQADSGRILDALSSMAAIAWMPTRIAAYSARSIR